ncbi:hypothetical protein DYL59_17130 [Pseudomonas kairouanensis]|uniref:Uncharacterized protein n=1 Tax=Pseudomonas kairouanensis TaxID=2293832 RepID=A0A4Z0ANN2_9PSED|nr:hypothetical protein [Pseudomonas kairouanensis]TFY87981.1 hypothetical protein DYL59_17130 [Pseudomonas kairouanensis]
MSNKTQVTQQDVPSLGRLSIPGLFPAHDWAPDIDGYLGRDSIDKPLLVYVSLPHDAHEGQLLELFRDNTQLPVAHTFVRKEDLQRAHVPLVLPAYAIYPSLIDTLVCRINQTGDYSQPMRLGVNLDFPVGADPDPLQSGHQGLSVGLPADIAIDGISEPRARQNVVIRVTPYSDMAAHDRLLLCWGNQKILRWVDPTEVGKTIDIRVHYTTILKARDSEGLLVTLQVRGYTGNLMVPSARWSAGAYVHVYAQGDTMESPVVVPMNDTTREITLADVADLPVTAYVFASRNVFETADKLHFHWVMTDAQGRTLTHSETQTVHKVGQSYTFNLANSQISKLGQGHLTMSYSLEKRDRILYSQSASATVNGQIHQWPAPKVIGVSEKGLLPSTGQATTVVLPWDDSWHSETRLTLVWQVPEPHCAVEYRCSRSVGERPDNNLIEFQVPALEVKRFEGRRSQMFCVIEQGQGYRDESRCLHLQVGPLQPQMQAPSIDRLNHGYFLDPGDVPNGVDVIIKGAPVGLIWLYWSGPKSHLGIPLLVQRPQDLTFHVPARYVQDNLNNTVKAYWTLTVADAPVRYSEVQTLHITRKKPKPRPAVPRKPGRRDNELPPIVIPNLFAPREGDTESDGAMGIRHAEQDYDVLLKKPAVIPLNSYIRLFWDSPTQPVSHLIVDERNINVDYFTIRVPKERIRSAWAYPFCIIKPPSDNETPTRPLAIWVDLTRPGGRDPNDEIPGHQGLAFVLPRDIEIDGVDDDRAKLNIDIEIQPYLNMGVFDTCFIAWGSQLVSHVVSASEVGNSFIMTVSYLTIQQAGDNDMLTVAMQVMNRAGSYPDEYARWSAPKTVRVGLDADLLEPPYLPRFLNDIVDLDILAGAPLEVHMYILRADAEVGDELLFIVQGVDAENLTIAHTELINIDRVPKLYSFWIGNKTITALADSTATLSYELYSINNKVKKYSRKLTAPIIGRYIPWPALDILEDDDKGYLSPDVSKATAVFYAQPGWTPEHWLTVSWTASDSDGTVTFFQQRLVGIIPPDGKMVFEFSSPDIVSFNGMIVSILYTLQDRQVNPEFRRNSLPLYLRVGELKKGLDFPIVHLAKGDWLGENLVPATGATGEIPFIETVKGDTLILEFLGETPELSDSLTFKLDDASAGKAVPFTLTKNLITANLNKRVALTYKLEREGQLPRFSKTLSLIIERRTPVLSDNFENIATQLVGPAGTVETSSMQILNVSGVSQCGVSGYLYTYAMMRVGQSISLSHETHADDNPQVVRLTFKFHYRFVKFAITWLHYPAEIKFFDGGTLLYTYRAQGLPNHLNEWIQYTASAGHIITHIDVTTTDHSFLDFFTYRL